MSAAVVKRKRGGERFKAAIEDQAVLQRAQASVEASRWHVVGAAATKNDAKNLIRDLTNFINTAYRSHLNYAALKDNPWADVEPPIIGTNKATDTPSCFDIPLRSRQGLHHGVRRCFQICYAEEAS